MGPVQTFGSPSDVSPIHVMDQSPVESPTATLSAGSRTGSWSSGCSSSSTLFEIEIDRSDAVSAILVDAILAGDVPQVQSLVRDGAWIAPSHQWALYQACLQGLDMISALLGPGVDFKRKIPDEEGESVIHFLLRTPASQFVDKKTDVIRLLLNHNVSAVAPGRLGDAPLHTVAGDKIRLEGYAVMKVLLGNKDSGEPFISEDRRKHINSENGDPYKATPLVIAVVYNNVDCARLLLENGADPGLMGGNAGGRRRPPLYFAVEGNNVEMAKLLLDYGAEMDPETQAMLSPAMKESIGSLLLEPDLLHLFAAACVNQ